MKKKQYIYLKGEVLRKILLYNNMTQADFAKQISTNEEYLSNLLNGNMVVGAGLRNRISIGVKKITKINPTFNKLFFIKNEK